MTKETKKKPTVTVFDYEVTRRPCEIRRKLLCKQLRAVERNPANGKHHPSFEHPDS